MATANSTVLKPEHPVHDLAIEFYENPKKGCLQTSVQRMTEMCAKELQHCSNLLGYNLDYASNHFDRYEVKHG